MAAYERCLELKPDCPEALANLADAFWLLGRIEEAKEAATRAGKACSDKPEFHYCLAELYLKLGMRHEANREREILTQLDPAGALKLAKLFDESENS